MDESFEARAARRRREWQEGFDAEPMRASDSTLAERIAAMRVVSESAWAFAGRELPGYTRAEMPGRVVRRT